MQRQREVAPTSMGPSVVIEDTAVFREGEGGLSSSESPDSGVIGTLRLRGGHLSNRRVAWSDEVIDNEGMGKKKSKVCCIFHKQRRFDESSSDESSSSSDDDSDSDADHNPSKDADAGPSSNNPDQEGHGAGCAHHHHHKRRARKPNAYERQPKYGPKKT
ncbi:phosphatase inhibitor-domain-containing protein [Myxozyma melibiosi]|uniref:Type 1 phosphatases regulator n=1 Tax=Myxozyma melibiosi TaxID=54550 RepID=A0ABR1F6M7_9ASCO